jgi:3',5'-cyclic AMP phosphodiesterase CpdA
LGGERYYSFKPAAGVRFFAVDSTYIDPPQLEWLAKELAASGSDWKIAFMHHPMYSSGDRHGPAVEKREALEPVFLKNGVSVVLTGHEHFYERLKPQKGVYYFISGGAAKLRPGTNVSDLTEKGFDDDRHFMLMEISGDDLYFQAISRMGRTVDSGRFRNPLKPAQETASSTPK